MSETENTIKTITAQDGTVYTPCETSEADGLWSNGKFIEGEFENLYVSGLAFHMSMCYHRDWQALGAIPVKKVVPKKEPQTVESVYRETLEKLARLGNGDRFGNSDGNIIAQNAIAWADSRLKPAPELVGPKDGGLER